MGREHLPDTDGVPEHAQLAFIVIFDEADSDGLEVTKQSIESQVGVQAKIFCCQPNEIQTTKESISDKEFVILMRSGDVFYSDMSCLEIIDNMKNGVSCIYTDSIISDDGYELPQLMFPFSLDTVSSGYMITNVALSSKLFKSLDINEKLNFLLGHDIITKALHLTKVRHLAEYKFVLPSRKINIKEELSFIGVVN